MDGTIHNLVVPEEFVVTTQNKAQKNAQMVAICCTNITPFLIGIHSKQVTTRHGLKRKRRKIYKHIGNLVT